MRKVLLHSFSRRLDALERTQKRAETLFAEGRLRQTDTEAIYEGLFLRAVTAFEAFLEEYFYLIVGDKAGFPRSARVGSRYESKSVELEAVVQNKKYVDWLPFDKTKKRADIFLKGGRPYSGLVAPHPAAIERCVVTRHAIAHSSSHAKKRFKAEVIQNLVLRPTERTPAGFLRSIAILPDTRRFNLMIGDIRTAAIVLTM